MINESVNDINIFSYHIFWSLYLQVPQDFEFSLYELDWSVFGFSMQEAVKLMPVFETLGIKTTVCGPESFTPDHKPILGMECRSSRI